MNQKFTPEGRATGSWASTDMSQRLDPVPLEAYLSKASFSVPNFKTESAWLDHAPFAFWLMNTLRPGAFVELGTHGGFSYFAFCQAVREANLPTRCYAIDTWQGDEHAGFYGDEVYKRVSDHNQAYYTDFSRLVRSTFDEALAHFANGTIDLLHIDGRHFFEDVKHDFESWRPKLSDRAVVVFHDTNVRERQFGVFRLWEELRDTYPSFEFLHGHGLGVLGFGPRIPQEIAAFLTHCRAPENATFVRTAYARLGSEFKVEMELGQIKSHAINLSIRGDHLDRVISDLNTKLSEANARSQALDVRLDALDAQLRETIAARDHHHRDSVSLRDELQRITGDLQSLTLELHRRSDVIATMQGSLSWRITTPIRKIRRAATLLSEATRTLRRQPQTLPYQLARYLYRIAPLPNAAKGWIVKIKAPREVARPLEIDYSVAIPFGYPTSCGAPKLAVICHVFYEELAPEIRRYLRNIPFAFNVFISTNTEQKKAAIEAAFRGWTHGTVDVRVTQNRGRDITPKLVGFADIYRDHDYVLHIHTKSSKHASVLEAWRGYIFETLIGSPQIVASVFDAFTRHPELGMIAPQHFEGVRDAISWGGNFKHADRLARRIGIANLSAAAVLDFPSGSMFWARTAALKPLLDLKLTFDDFVEEQGQLDATLAHAIERLYFHVCERAGYRWLKVASPPLLAHTPAILTIDSAAALDEFVAKHTLMLTGSNLPAPRKERLPPITPAPGCIARIQNSALGVSEKIDPATGVAVGFVGSGESQPQVERAIASAQKAAKRTGLHTNVNILIANGDAGEFAAPAAQERQYPSKDANTGFARAQNRLMEKAFVEGADVYIAASPEGLFHPASIGALLQMMAAHDHRALIQAETFPARHAAAYDPLTMNTDSALATCLAIPRVLFETIGGFDESLSPGHETMDYATRARVNGFAICVCPRALFSCRETQRSH